MNSMLLTKKVMTSAGALLCWVALPLMADTVGMRTAKTEGQTLTLAANNGVTAVLDWGNGNTVDFVFTGSLQEIPVLGDSLQIRTNEPLTSFYCADNELLTLSLNQAKSLETLVCNDNRLKRLDLYQNRNMKTVNCQRNELTYFRVQYCTQMQSLNCAQNPLEALSLGQSMTALTTLICADMQLEKLDVSRLPRLRQLWCQDNRLTVLNLSKNTELRCLYAFGNQLADLDVSMLSELTDLYVDDNLLETLDLSATLNLQTVSIDHNRLTEVKTTLKSKNALKYFYANDNRLAYNSLPTVYSTSGSGRDLLDKYNVAPQQDIPVVEAVSVGERLDLSALLNKNAWGTAVIHSLTWKMAEGDTELVSDEDFTLVKKGIYTFLKPLGDVYAEVTAPTYPGLTLRTTAVKVMTDATPVGSVSAEEYRIATEPHTLVVTVARPMRVTVVAADGRVVVGETVEAGTYRWRLSAGVYVVNGRKILISR